MALRTDIRIPCISSPQCRACTTAQARWTICIDTECWYHPLRKWLMKKRKQNMVSISNVNVDGKWFQHWRMPLYYLLETTRRRSDTLDWARCRLRNPKAHWRVCLPSPAPSTLACHSRRSSLYRPTRHFSSWADLKITERIYKEIQYCKILKQIEKNKTNGNNNIRVDGVEVLLDRIEFHFALRIKRGLHGRLDQRTSACANHHYNPCAKQNETNDIVAFWLYSCGRFNWLHI